MWESIELRELRIFLTLSEELHFGRTAERLQISQSRVSQAMRTLEARVGGKLFERTSRHVRLTPVGQRLLLGATPAYEQLQRAFDDAREAAAGVAGTLRVGIYARISCGPHWREIVQAFKARHPGCDVDIIHTNFDHNYLDLLRRGEFEVFATRIPLTDPTFAVGPILSREQRVLMVAKDDPLARRESVRFDDLADRAVSDHPTMPREMMDAFIPPATSDGRRLRRISFRNFEEALILVAAGEVVHPTVTSFSSYYVHDGVVAVPISDLPPSETALVWLSANRSPMIQAFARAAADVLAADDERPRPSATVAPTRAAVSV